MKKLAIGDAVIVFGTSCHGRIAEINEGRERKYHVQLWDDGQYPARDAWYAARELRHEA